MSKDISKLIDRGNKAFGQQDYKRAQKLYEQALKLAPLDQTVIFNLGVAYQAEGNIDQAILCYQKIDKIADAKNNVGVIFENQGELEKAQEAYEAALKIDSNFKIAEENLNRLNRKMGLAPGEKSKKVTMADFTPEILESIRNSFAYQGLLRAFKNKIISLDDVKAEAETEAKNVNLPAGQRVHTVLVNDLGQGDLIKSDKEKGADVIDDEVNKVNKVNTVVNKAGGDELLSELKQKLGPDFGPGWQGIDKDGDLMEVLEVNPSGWLKFRVDRISGELDIFSYPFSRF
ncbi:tetratricopeptide repeat protein, partial [Patescibacteria group bacterium]|nr:tetratricopeptide repeat protein [Patescibacteria group bacterium]